MLKLSDFDYQLPKDLIAQYPLKTRDTARILVIERARNKIYHDKFYNIIKYLPKNSVLILNDSKVLPARLWGRREKTSGKVEILLLNRLRENCFKALINPLKKLKIDERIIFNNHKISCRLVDPKEKILHFNTNILKHLEKIGHIPLPPYIKRPDNESDWSYYQTVYAKHNGSIASPTAGLHFTDKLLKKIQDSGIKIANVTLHINYATFKPVKEEDITQHKMYEEKFSVPKKTIEFIRDVKSCGGKIVAVGTTTCRLLETIANNRNYSGSTNLFIYPGFKFKLTDMLITNFHFPKSTLLMLVCAFANRDLIIKAYQEAIEKKYRFYSYGDAMLII